MNKDDSDGFVVRQVAVEESEELNSFIVGMSTTPDGSDSVLLLEKGLTFDEQDRALGQDTYCLSIASGATVYGGIVRCILRDGVLNLGLTHESADTLGIAQTCVFQLEVDPASIAQLRDGLRRILAGESSPDAEILL